MEPNYFQTIVRRMKPATSKAMTSRGPKFFFKEWRKKRRLTQEQLAELVGVTPPSISQLENGKQGFTDTTLLQIASALKCHPGELLMRDPTIKEGWRLYLQKAVDQAFEEGVGPEHIRAEIEQIAPLLRIEDVEARSKMDEREQRLRDFGETSAARLGNQDNKNT